MFTRKEFRRLLRKQFWDRGIRLKKSERLGLSIEALAKFSAKRNKNVLSPYLDLWIEILDELISWLFSLYTVVHDAIADNKGKANDFERSIWMILMKLVADSLALRHLILAGYDVQARVLLRSTFEYFELLVALFDDPQLATEFMATDDPKIANVFWKKHLAKGKIRKRIKNAWLKLFRNSEVEAAEQFANWGFGDYGKLSALERFPVRRNSPH